MSTEPKAVARRYYDILNQWDPPALAGVCAPDLRGHAGAGADLAQLTAAIGSFVEAFPDLRVEVRHLVCEDDLVSSWVTYSGTHGGSFAGVHATGTSIRVAAWDLLRVRDGRIAEITMYCDLFTLMNQIGALPTTVPA
jgi:steroid delta-isomerase-like uncharacterized protein